MTGLQGQFSDTPPLSPPKRPRELEDGLNYYLYHPLAWRLARALSHTPITPNMVSVLGGCCVVAAGICYAQPGWPLWPLIGLLLHMGWHVVDGADGDLARLTGKASPFGEMIDGICDYASHIIVYFILGWLLARQIGPVAYVLMWAAGFSHIAQANHVEVQRRSYQWWVYDKPWLRQTREDADQATRKGVLGGLVSTYMAVAARIAGSTAQIDEAVANATPAQRERIRAAARAEGKRLLPMLMWLGPNPRTIALGISMLLGSPLWFFLWQVVVLNLLLAYSIHAHEAAAKRMLVTIDG